MQKDITSSFKQIKTVKCCNNCKYYQPEPAQPWEEGLNDYVCYRHDKCTKVDNYCSSYENKKQSMKLETN